MQRTLFPYCKFITQNKKRLSSVEMLITDAAAYNICAFNIMKTSYPNIHFITCYPHLLGNIVSKIPIFHANLTDFLTKMNDFFLGRKKLQYLYY